jgi:hypothetical protein
MAILISKLFSNSFFDISSLQKGIRKTFSQATLVKWNSVGWKQFRFGM